MRGNDFLQVSDDAPLYLAGFRVLLGGGGRKSDNGVSLNHELYKPGQ